MEALFVFFPAFICLYLGMKDSFAFFRTAGASRPSDRPRSYENQSDLPPNPYSLEKTAPRVEQTLTPYHPTTLTP